MCYKYRSIKSSNPNGQTHTFIPCGCCEECRNEKKNSWAFRLALEAQNARKNGWSVGFITLTYNDVHLPLVPEECFTEDFRPIPCFSRKIARTFVDSLRKWAFREYGVTGIKYLLASEYGKETRRPHHHAIFMFPPQIPQKAFYDEICTLWTKYGFVIPAVFTGGTDSKGQKHKPFIIDGEVVKGARYCAKYTCKDLDFQNTLDGVDTRCKLFRTECDSFHIQSQSLGWSLIKDLSDDEKLDIIKNGMAFIGSDKLLQVPLYIKNKIIFTPYYVIDEHGQRLVRKTASPFFRKHAKLILEKKIAFYEKLFEQSKDINTYLALGFAPAEAKKKVDFTEACTLVLRNTYNVNYTNALATHYTLYYGLPYEKCYDIEPSRQLVLRYNLQDLTASENLINYDYYLNLNQMCGEIVGLFGFKEQTKTKETEHSALVARCRDFWKNEAV